MTTEQFAALCKKHNARTIFKNQVELAPIGAYWYENGNADDIPKEKEAWPVVFDVIPEYDGSTEVRAYAPENWFPAKFSCRDTPFD